MEKMPIVGTNYTAEITSDRITLRSLYASRRANPEESALVQMLMDEHQSTSGAVEAVEVDQSRINVNHAIAPVLALLPGIGKVTATEIIEEREIKPFESFADLNERTGVNLKSEVQELVHF